MQRVVGREYRSGLAVGHDPRADRLGQRHPALPRLGIARGAAHQDHRPLGPRQQFRRLPHQRAAGLGRSRRREARDIGHDRHGFDLVLLQGQIEIEVDRPARCRLRDHVGAQHSLLRRADRGGLVVPFGEVADQRTLVARGVDPFDPWPPPRRIERAGGAEHDHRRPVAPGVEDCHRRMHQADIGVDDGEHRPARDLGPAMRQRHRTLLVQAQQHARPAIAEVVDEAVVQAAIARARVQCDIGDVEFADRRGDRVAAPDLVRRRARQWPVDLIPGSLHRLLGWNIHSLSPSRRRFRAGLRPFRGVGQDRPRPIAPAG